jgi:hypothetical protein
MGTSRSSKPLSGAGCGVGGGFDSHALPPIRSTAAAPRLRVAPSFLGNCIHGHRDVLLY